MTIEIKILLTAVFLGLIVAAFFIDPKNPGPAFFWKGNHRLLEVVTNDGTLKKGAKPFFVVLFLVFFLMCTYVIWFGR